ncbi:MAG TPA: hypothetical protein VIB00_03305 [Pyrinomonadaceae bacterium]|jgi:hypothetical protein
MNRSLSVIIIVLGALVLWILSTGIPGLNPSSTQAKTAESTQDPATLDRRISMLEQRFYIVENSVRRLEQQVIQRPTPLGDQRADTTALRAELERLKAHIETVECAVAKLDERTLSASERSGRQDSAYKDPCRLNPTSPLRLPSRP